MDKRLVWVSAGLIFCLGVESAGLQLALLRVSTEFRLSPMMMGTFATVQYAAMLIVQPIFGVVSDKLGKKRIASGGVFVFIIGCLIASIAGAPLTFMAGVFVVGVGFSVVESMLSAAVTDAFPSKAEQYINLTQSLFCAGAMLSPIITNWLITEFGFTWRAAFVMADCGAAALAPFLLTTPFAKPLRGALWPILCCVVGLIPLPILLMNLHLLRSPGVTALWLLFALINPFFEEIYWRGYLLFALPFPKWLAVAYSTALFIASHPLMWGVFSIANRSLMTWASLALMGVVWSLTRLRTDNLRWCVLSHFAVDICNLSVFVFLNLYVPPVM